MATVSMTGNDSIIINNRVINDLADGDCIMLSFPTEIASVKTGKNGNAIYALNQTGKQAELKIRLIRGGSDDQFLLSLLNQQQNSFQTFVLMIGEFIKLVGDGSGNITNDTYIVSGGVFVKQVDAKSNVDGDTAQSVSEYTIRFANAPRALS